MNYIENGYYMVMPKDPTRTIEERKPIRSCWEMVQFKNKRMFRFNNLNSYPLEDFDTILPFELFSKFHSMQHQIKFLKEKVLEFENSRRNMDTHYDAIEKILSVVKSVVDQLNGEIVFSCNDLETVNQQLILAFNQYKNLCGENR